MESAITLFCRSIVGVDQDVTQHLRVGGRGSVSKRVRAPRCVEAFDVATLRRGTRLHEEGPLLLRLVEEEPGLWERFQREPEAPPYALVAAATALPPNRWFADQVAALI